MTASLSEPRLEQGMGTGTLRRRSGLDKGRSIPEGCWPCRGGSSVILLGRGGVSAGAAAEGQRLRGSAAGPESGVWAGRRRGGGQAAGPPGAAESGWAAPCARCAAGLRLLHRPSSTCLARCAPPNHIVLLPTNSRLPSLMILTYAFLLPEHRVQAPAWRIR